MKTPLLLSVAVFTTLQALLCFDIGYYVTSANASAIVLAEQKAIQSEKKSLPFSLFVHLTLIPCSNSIIGCLLLRENFLMQYHLAI